jgi:hypothetical protein
MDREIGTSADTGELGWDRIEALQGAGIPRWLPEENAECARVWVPAENYSRTVEFVKQAAA